MSLRLPPAHSPITARVLSAAWLPRPGATRVLRSYLMDRYGAESVVLTDSGTTALALALRVVATAAPGLPVALPGYGCYDLATAAEAAGVRVLLYDVNPPSLGPDWESLERVVEHGVAAVVVAHLFGVPVDVDRARDVAKRAGAVLVEDAAQGVGIEYGGRRAGAQGALGVLSFGRGKGWTGGGGGALLVRDAALGGAVRQLTDDVVARSEGSGRPALALGVQWVFGRPTLFWLPAAMPGLRLGETVYRTPGEARSIAPASARAVRAGAVAAWAEADVRRRRAGWWREALTSGAGVQGVNGAEAACPGWLRFPIRAGDDMAAVLGGPVGQRFGAARAYPRPLHDLARFRESVVGELRPLPGATALAQGLWTLPTHRWVGRQTVAALTVALQRATAQRRGGDR